MSLPLKVQRLRKEYIVSRITKSVSNAALVAVAHTGNMTHADRSSLRRTVSEAGGEVTFAKNTLCVKALEAAGGPAIGLAPLLRGNTVLATGPAEVPVAAALLGAAKTLPDFHVLGALLDQRRLLQFYDVDKLAKLPPAEQLHTNLIMQMLPGTSLQIPNMAAYLCAILQQHVEQQGGGGGGAPPS